MTAIALPRQRYSAWLERLRSIRLGLGARGALGLGLGRSQVSAAETPWYLAGGAPAPVAVYQPIGAASLAASYVNIVNPGTYDAAPGVAPTWAAATGWTFNGSTQYLTTGVVPTASYSVVVRFSGTFDQSQNRLLITARSPDQSNRFYMATYIVDRNKRSYGYGDSYLPGSSFASSGVMALAANDGYFNGSIDVSDISPTTSPTLPFVIGALWDLGVVKSGFFDGDIQAVAIYTATLTAPQVAAVSAAMAAL